MRASIALCPCQNKDNILVNIRQSDKYVVVSQIQLEFIYSHNLDISLFYQLCKLKIFSPVCGIALTVSVEEQMF